MKVWNIGYPRIGDERELKSSVESFWRNELSREELLEAGKSLLIKRWQAQHNLGVDSIPLNDFSFFDPLLDAAWLFNLLPAHENNSSHWLDKLFLFARGSQDGSSSPLKIAKWFNTNYHSLLPEVSSHTKPKLQKEKLAWEIECTHGLPFNFHFSLIGPWTLAKHCQLKGVSMSWLLDQLAPLYKSLLKDLGKKGFEWVQLEEPSFGGDLEKEEVKLIQKCYEGISGNSPKIMISTYFESPDPWLSEITQLPAHGFHFDVVAGPATLSWIKTRSFPKEKILCLGLVDGRNIWAAPLSSLYKQMEILKGFHSPTKMMLAPSAPLSFLPVCKTKEQKLQKDIPFFKCISFANQRLEELARLKKAIQGTLDPKDLEQEEIKQREEIRKLQKPKDSVQNLINKIEPPMKRRSASFTKRFKVQQKRLGLPRLPCTTIGSFPQTAELRKARKLSKDGGEQLQRYQQLVTEEIKKVIELQEKVGIDVLVHGESERSDMVEYFAEQWDGFQTTEAGWVQSFGVLCAKPPIIMADIERKGQLTTPWFKVAQSFTQKPVKGIVTGPITLVNWSFVRQDQPIEKTALQAALAIRAEIRDLEAAGAKIIQVDEAALREGWPLKKMKRANYLKWVVEIFKLATSGVRDETQIHTHFCYTELSEIMEVIAKLDSDVYLVESTRSAGSVLNAFKSVKIENSVGPGLFDVHAKHVPSTQELELALRKCFEVFAPDKIWVSPDCGLKAMSYEEIEPALANMVEAAKRIRKLLS